MAESVKGILFHICTNRKTVLDLGISQFTKAGGLLFGLRKGIYTLQLGEEAIVFQCDLVLAFIQRTPQDHCTSQLPVIIHQEQGPVMKYLTPTSRILTDQGDPTVCSDGFRIDSKLSICQFNAGGGLVAYPSTTSLDPKEGVYKYIMRTLSREKSVGPRYELKSQISRLLVSFITAKNFHQSL